MEKVDKTEVERVACLARLQLTETEKVEYAEQLTEIFNVVNQINDINVDGEIMFTPTNEVARLRSDVVGEALDVNDVKKNAPEVKDDYIVVPRVIE